MNRDFRQPVYTLLGLFGLLGVFIFIFVLMGDMSQPNLPLRVQDAYKLDSPPRTAEHKSQPIIESSNYALPVKQYSSQKPQISDALEIETGDTLEGYAEEPIEPVQSSFNNPCHCEDGMHKARVGYSDPGTRKSATYTVDVTVLNCQVIAIDFPKLGWLDGDQFSAANITEHGEASFEDDKRRTFVVHLNNR